MKHVLLAAVTALAGVACTDASARPDAGGSGSAASSGAAGTTGLGGSTGQAGSGIDAGDVIPPGDPGTGDVSFDVGIDRDVHPISPLIYGWNGAGAIADDGQTVVRAGGNRWTAYNWENNASNAGSDYMFQNDNYLDESTEAGHAVRATLDAAKAHDAAALITVPIVDYVAADVGPGGDVRNSGASYLMTRFKQNKPTKGSAFSTSPAGDDAYVYQDEFVSWAKGAYGGQQVIFSLDNEPDLWSVTHSEVHPNKLTYAELVMRNISFATAIKAVWPTAEVTGFVSYGWNGYENLQGAPDAGGNGEFLTYYLDKMKAAESMAGQRLVDYLDLHWYPELYAGNTRILDNKDASAASVAVRLQGPRSLWDPTYNEGSWISKSAGVGPIALIPRLKAKIAAHYPGTKLAFTEYTYGGGADISGGIAQADVFGIFGREGVDMATAWNWSDNGYQLAALRLFRNYDGAGGHVGDTAIHAGTTDVVDSSVYASVDAGDPNRLFIVAINKKTAPLTAAIRVTHAQHFRTAAVYTLTSAGPTVRAGTAVTAVDTNAFNYTMPAMSVSLLVPQP